jgi:C4-dicarboxylate-specific signal transduction histidine kinase
MHSPFDPQSARYRDILRHTSRIMVSNQRDDQVADQVMETLVGAMQVTYCALYYRSESQQAMIRYSIKGKLPLAAMPARFDHRDELVRHLNRCRQPVVQNAAGDPPVRAEKTVVAKLVQLAAGIAVPVFFRKRLAGMVLVGEKTDRRRFDRQEIDLLEHLAGLGALAIENTRSYRRLEALNQELESRVASRTHALKAALAEKVRTQERLIRSESLAAIGQLVAGTAHELNNPLASATSLVQSVIEELDTVGVPDEIMGDLRTADRELHRARDIISSLLDLSRQTRSYSEPVEMNRVVTDALHVLANRIKHSRVHVAKQLAAQLPTIEGNFAALGQVALNLIANALDAVPANEGMVSVVTAYEKSSGVVSLQVDDNGPGVPSKIRKAIFNPFFTTKPVGAGTGLGLYICHEIINRHGGTLSLQPAAKPVGGRFVVKLKAQPPEA